MSDTVRIVVTGDTHLGGGRVKELSLKGDTHSLFGDFLPIIKGADLSITNLESPLIENGEPIAKTGPNLKSPVAAADVLKSAGFGLVTLANNHIMDYGSEGLRSTFDACKEAGIATTGAGSSLKEAKKPFVRDIRGVRLAVINIAENEFGTTMNGTPGCYPMNPVDNYYAIREAAAAADRVIVIVHGGHEHYELPSPRMKEIYRFYADAGADAVIGHHTHCTGPVEIYRGTPIFYSIGNFLFDKPYRGKATGWNVGVMAELLIDENEVSYNMHPYIQCAETAGLRKPDSEELEAFENKQRENNRLLQNDAELEERFNRFCESLSGQYSSYLEPHSIRALHALRNRSLAPSLLTKRKKRLLLNLTRCEAHRDVIIKLLKK